MLHLLFAATLLLASAGGDADVTLIGQYALPAEGRTYGGLSAIHISDDGRKVITVSDRGTIATGDIQRGPDGAIVDIEMAPPVALKPYPHETRAALRDAEGIAVDAEGTIYISFEGYHRIGRFADIDAQEEVIARPRDFEGFQGNAGLEAIAIGPDGAIYTMPERSGRRDTPFPVYRYVDGAWSQPYAIPRSFSYLIVGADFGPDGKLYLLERDFGGIGFLTRVRRVDFATSSAETLLETGFGVHGNMEGISVWENPAGELIMTLIADDNFSSLLINEIAEYRIDG